MNFLDRSLGTRVLLALGLCVAAPLCAAQSVQLTYLPQPGRTVEMRTTNTSWMEMDIKADAAVLEQARRRGMTLPMKMKVESTQRLALVSSPSEADGAFPFEMVLVQSETTGTDNTGRPVKLPNTSPVGMRMLGRLEANKDLKFLGVQGGAFPPEFAALAPKLFESLFAESRKLEGIVLRPGEPPVRRVAALEIPLPGMPPVRFQITTDYKLMDVAGDVARIQLTIGMAMDQAPGAMNMSGQGSGQGVMAFDQATKVVTSMTSSSAYDISVGTPQFVMLIKGQSTDVMTSEIARK